LNDAVSNLIRSRSLRPDFTPSLLNLATAYFLLGEKEMAGAYLSMASRRIAHESNERLMSMGDNLKGIMRACESDSKARKEAEALFRKAMAISPYAASNLALLRTGKPEEAVGNQRFDRITVDGKQLIWRNQGSRLVKAGKLDLKVAEWDWVNGYELGDFVVFVIGAASQLVCDGVPFKEGDALPGGASPIPATFSLHDYYTYNNLFLARGSTGKIESRIIINPTYD
jgi:tetratricopeptide (TPR) repeat protein